MIWSGSLRDGVGKVSDRAQGGRGLEVLVKGTSCYCMQSLGAVA